MNNGGVIPVAEYPANFRQCHFSIRKKIPHSYMPSNYDITVPTFRLQFIQRDAEVITASFDNVIYLQF
jgi:hypothetical protein